MAERLQPKSRTCTVCRRVVLATAAEIKTHAAACTESSTDRAERTPAQAMPEQSRGRHRSLMAPSIACMPA